MDIDKQIKEPIEYLLQTKNPRVYKGLYSSMEEALEEQRKYEESTGIETTITEERRIKLF